MTSFVSMPSVLANSKTRTFLVVVAGGKRFSSGAFPAPRLVVPRQVIGVLSLGILTGPSHPGRTTFPAARSAGALTHTGPGRGPTVESLAITVCRRNPRAGRGIAFRGRNRTELRT